MFAPPSSVTSWSHVKTCSEGALPALAEGADRRGGARRDEQPARRTALSIGFLLQPDFTLLAFAGFVDALRLAADERDGSRPIRCSWAVVSDVADPIRASCGIHVQPTASLVDPRRFDYIVVVGGLLGSGQRMSVRMIDYVRAADREGVPLAGICTGSFVLARAGLMRGYRACVSWFHHEEFRREFPDHAAVSSQLFVVDRNRITCAGGTSVVHLAAHLIERHCSKTDSAKALRIMIEKAALSPRTPQPQPSFAHATDNVHVRRAMLLMERNIGAPLSMDSIARQTHLSQRQLERLFRLELGMSPTQFALRLRLHAARELLASTMAPVSAIAAECGFSDGAHFSRSFRKWFRESPSVSRAAARRSRHAERGAGEGAPRVGFAQHHVGSIHSAAKRFAPY
jgi:transcriptional regulator GlxA family with amidase domain